MASDLDKGIFIDEVMSIPGIGDVRVLLDRKALQAQDIYEKAFRSSRRIKAQDEINAADPYVLYFMTQRGDTPEESADEAISNAQQFYLQEEREASLNSYMVAMLDDIFEVQVNDLGQRVLIIKPHIHLEPITKENFNFEEMNAMRGDAGLPPILQRSPWSIAEQKLAYIMILADKEPNLARRLNDYLNTSVASEIRKEQNKLRGAETSDAGFPANGTGGAKVDGVSSES